MQQISRRNSAWRSIFGRSREVLDDLRKKGVPGGSSSDSQQLLFVKQPDRTIKSAVSIDGPEVIPFAGVSSKLTILCNEGGQWMDYRSDERRIQ